MSCGGPQHISGGRRLAVAYLRFGLSLCAALVICFGLVMTAKADVPAPLLISASDASNRAQDSRVEIVVLPIDIEGRVSEEQRRIYNERLAETLNSTAFEIYRPERQSSAAKALAECSKLRCGSRLARKFGAQLLLRSRLRVRDRSYSVKIELYEGTTQVQLATSNEDCDICGREEVKQMVSARAAVIKDKIESLTAQSVNLTVESTPSGAEVRVDGKPVGLTPIQHFVTPGEHEVVVAREGYADESKAVEVVSGVREILTFRLDKERGKRAVLSPQTRDRSDRARKSLISMQAWGFLTLGGSVLSGAAGATLLALHDKPYTRDCEGMNVDANGTCRFKYDTQKYGIIFVSVGGALAVTSVVLLATGAAKKKKMAKRKASNTAKVDVDWGIGPRAVVGRLRF